MFARCFQRLTRAAVWVLAVCTVPVGTSPLFADDLAATRAFLVNGIHNARPGFMVRVSVDRDDRIYREGQSVRFTVRSEKNGYLYLLNARVDGKVTCIFPNRFQPDNQIRATTPIDVPAKGA